MKLVLKFLKSMVFHAFFRHGGISEVTNKGAPPGVVELNGRWRKSNQSGARKPNITISEQYIDIRLVLDQLLVFSQYL